MRPHYLVSRELPFVTTFMLMFGTAQEEGGIWYVFLSSCFKFGHFNLQGTTNPPKHETLGYFASVKSFCHVRHPLYFLLP